MNTDKILNSTILDIIFEGKNKLYGAYELRKSYDSRLTKALLFTIALAIVFFLCTAFTKTLEKTDSKIEVIDTRMAEIKKDIPPPVTPLPPKVQTPPATIKAKQQKFTIPVIIRKENIPPDETIETITDNTSIGSQTIKSNNSATITDVPLTNTASSVIQVPRPDDDNTIFTSVQIEASFSEGNAGWVRFLEKNLNAGIPVDNGAPAGSYTVMVQFIVYKDGSVNEVTATTHHGYGMEAEAIRAIKKSGKWKPALQNGTHVNAYRNQPITFVVEEN